MKPRARREPAVRRPPPTDADGGGLVQLPSPVPRRIAVLGAGGFIGSHLVPALLARHADTQIEAVDVNLTKLEVRSPRLTRRQAALDTPGLLDELTARCDVVVSLTALCNPALYNTRPLEVIDASYTDLVPLVKLCAARGNWLVHLSTCEVYGKIALDGDGLPMAEMREDETSLFLGPVHKERWTYAAAKQLLERVIWAHGRHAGLKFTLVRPFNVIGPRMDFVPGVDGDGIPRVLASFMHALMTGADLAIVDGGAQRRAFVSVGEFVDGLLRIVERPRLCQGEILNLGNPDNDVTIRELADEVARAYRDRRPDGPEPRRRDVTAAEHYGAGYDDSLVRVPSIDKARRLLDWHPTLPLREMLPSIVDDYLARYEPALAARRPARAGGGGA
ncbi:MAG: NAD-dependent epimerase/dehydratase family protein [Pseudomonadota bacterium]